MIPTTKLARKQLPPELLYEIVLSTRHSEHGYLNICSASGRLEKYMRPRVLLWKKIPLRINYEEESLHLIFGPLMKTLFERKWDFSFNQNSSEFYQDVNSFNEYIIWIMEDLNVFNPQFLLELRELTESIRLLVGEQSQPKMSVALSTLSVPALRQPHCVEQPDKRTFFSKIPISTFLTKRGLKKGGPKDGV